MRGEAAIGMGAGMAVGARIATGAGSGDAIGVPHAPKVAAGEDIGIEGDAVGSVVYIAAVGDIGIGGGATTGPPDIIFENAIGSIPGGIGIPPIFAAATISAAVGSIVPVMWLYPGGPEEVVEALGGTQGLAASLAA